MRERASELEYLKWFRFNIDLGPAEEDAIEGMNRDFMKLSGKNLPEGWNVSSDGETTLDEE